MKIKGYRSRLGQLLWMEEKRRQGKLPPIDPPRQYLDRADRSFFANMATTLDVEEDLLGKQIAELFDDFNLDPSDPINWRILVMALAQVLYGLPRNKPGRPRGADELLQRALKAELAARPKASDRDIARAIAKKAPEVVNKGCRDGVIGLERRVRRERKAV